MVILHIQAKQTICQLHHLAATLVIPNQQLQQGPAWQMKHGAMLLHIAVSMVSLLLLIK